MVRFLIKNLYTARKMCTFVHQVAKREGKVLPTKNNHHEKNLCDCNVLYSGHRHL